MRFSVSMQSFYDDEYEKNALVNDIPNDVKNVTREQYQNLFLSINEGRRIFISNSDYNISEIRPDIYHSWDDMNNEWVMTEEAEEQKEKDLISAAVATKTRLLSKASEVIAPLQDASDLDIAADTEIELLNAWKKYRVLVSRIDAGKAPDIVWPPEPEYVA